MRLQMSISHWLDMRYAPVFYATNKIEIHAVLHTADSRKFTNATIIEDKDSKDNFTILTDIGNIIKLNTEQIEKYYLPVVCKRVLLTQKVDFNQIYFPN